MSELIETILFTAISVAAQPADIQSEVARLVQSGRPAWPKATLDSES